MADIAMASMLDEPADEVVNGVRVQRSPDGFMALDFDFDPLAEQESEPLADADNLAEGMTPIKLATVAREMLELIDSDLESRKDWHEAFKRGLAECAVDGTEPTATRKGGATVVHPLIAEAAVQFQARAVAELFPASGPVKAMTVGKRSTEVDEQARRVEGHMNWQLIEEDEGYFDDVDQMLLVLPLAGSTFKRTYWDELEGRVTSEWVRAENVIIPYSARSIRTSPRVTIDFWLQPQEMDELRERGVYLSQEDAQLQKPIEVERNENKDNADKAEDTSIAEHDGEYHLYEVACWMSVESDKKVPKQKKGQEPRLYPYLVTIAVEDQKVISIRRNWKESSDGRIRPRQQLTHYRYLPGLGVYGWGLIHWIGNLGKAATAALRALLDSAAAANFQGGFASKEVAGLGKEIVLEHGKWKTTKATSEDLQKGFVTPPFKEPSMALVKLLEIMVGAGQRFASTTEAMVGEGDRNVPVGTTIARIEQASKVYSGIHRRLHNSAKHEFRLRAALNREHLLETQQFALKGSALVINPEDYDDRVDVIPVSDPNMVSMAQRVATAEAQITLARQSPAEFDMREANRRYLEAIQAPDIDKLMPDKSQIPMRDPVSEGALVMTGQAVKAYPEQNHQAHLAVHMAQLQMVAGSPVEQVAGPALQAHIADHMAQQYRVQMSAQLGFPIPDPGQKQEADAEGAIPPEIQDAIGMKAAMLAQQQQEQQAKEPPPEAKKILAEADEAAARAEKTRAEIPEVQARVLKTRQELVQGDDGTAAVLEQAMATIAELQGALQENFARDQAAEEERLNLIASVRDLTREVQAMKQQGAEAGKAKEGEEKEHVEIRRAEIDKEGKIEVAKVQAANEKVIAKLERRIDDLMAMVKDATKGKESSEKEGAEKEEKPAPAQPIELNVTVAMPPTGSKSVTIKRDKNGAIVGADVAPEKN